VMSPAWFAFFFFLAFSDARFAESARRTPRSGFTYLILPEGCIRGFCLSSSVLNGTALQLCFQIPLDLQVNVILVDALQAAERFLVFTKPPP